MAITAQINDVMSGTLMPKQKTAAAPVGTADVADADARRLASAIARGDESAFQELYDRYRERVFGLAMMLSSGDEVLAGEIVQSTFLTAARKLRRVESVAHLWNWLARVARQHAGKARRGWRRDISLIRDSDLEESAAQAAPDDLMEQCLDQALLALDPEDRQAVELYYFEKLSHKEIAGRLEATPKAVSSRLERARARLRTIIKHALTHET